MLLDRVSSKVALNILRDKFRTTLLSTWRAGGSRPQLGEIIQSTVDYRVSWADGRSGLAISGGVDSMALASLCGEMVKAERQGPSFAGFIVDHRLRENSRREAEKVALELQRLNIRPIIMTIDWTEYGDPSSLSNLESVARQLRYQALGTGCSQQDITSLMVAHHANDQAETVLLRLLGGYVGSGLAGMLEKSTQLPECGGIYGVSQSGTPSQGNHLAKHSLELMQVEGGGVTITRPLMQYTKALLTKHCQDAGVRWFEDHTNNDRTYTLRNTVRYLLQKNDLPGSLQKPRVLSLVHNIKLREKELERLAQQMFERTDIRLSTETGRAYVDLTNVCKTFPVAYAESYTVKTILLRKLLRLVSPRDSISLQDLHGAVDLIFPPDDQMSSSGLPQDSPKVLCQVAGVAVMHSNEASGSVRTRHMLQREVPPRHLVVSEERTLPIRHQQHTLHQGSYWASDWMLWDNRYWIRILNRRRHNPAVKDITVKFLAATDLTVLRQSMGEVQLRHLSRILEAARGNVRFTLPVIAVRPSSTPDSHATLPEQIVAIPTLRWSANGWDQWHSGMARDIKSKEWYWEIRYKHVEFPVSDSHQLVPPSVSTPMPTRRSLEHRKQHGAFTVSRT